MTTSCIVSFGSNALVIKGDAAVTLLNGGLQSFGNLDDLENDRTVTKPYATYEPDFWLLDGGYKFVPSSNAHGGWVSTDMSAGTGGFDYSAPKPDIQIDFDDTHSTDGLTLYFSEYSGDYADSIRVIFYNAALSIIQDDTYTPSATSFATGQAVANFKRIVIVINSSSRAQRYARLSRIDFDTLTRFTGSEIKAARVVEQINPLSVELPINTLELQLFSSDGDFSIVEPAGFYANLQYKEPLDVHEIIDSETVYIGRFYLDRWESISEDEATFEASDAIGLLDKPTFIGGLYNSPNIDSDVLIADIMEAAGVDYSLDASLEGITVIGFIDLYASCRDALQQVCFYIGAYATCSRSNIVNILPVELASDLTAYDHTLTSAEKGISSPLSLRPLVTGVELHKFDFVSDDFPTGEILFSGTLGTGDHQIILGQGSKMPSSLVLGGTASYTITLNRCTYVDVNVTSGGTVILTQNEGITILDTIEGVYNLSLPAGTPENVLTIRDVLIVADASGLGGLDTADIAQRIYDYYQQRYLQKTRLFGSLIAPGDSVLVDVQSSRQMAGIVERMETDLAGGYISQTEIIGVIL